MKTRTAALIALLCAGAACADSQDDAQALDEGQLALQQQPASPAQVAADKPLIHVWKSPT